MLPVIKILEEKILVGKTMSMSFANDKTAELWKSFMVLQNEIENKINDDMLSMQVYSPQFDFKNLDLNATFEKWAAIEVSTFEKVPEGMKTFILKKGLYAVFSYKGLSTDTEFFRYIFGTWLPASDFILADRPHFEILGEKYKNNDRESEEEIWIPVRNKK